MKYLILLLFLVGCGEHKPEAKPEPVTYMMENGMQVRCTGFSVWDCGIHLYNCDEVEIFCAHNVIKFVK